MFELTEERFIEFYNSSPETGMGYIVVTAFLKDGRQIPQVVLNSGTVTQVKGYATVPFTEADVDHFVATHDKWNFNR